MKNLYNVTNNARSSKRAPFRKTWKLWRLRPIYLISAITR